MSKERLLDWMDKMNYAEHKLNWQDCQLCELSKCRSRVVLARGVIPAAVCFIGEAPGISEDTIGQCFIGPAGKLLDRMIEKAVEKLLAEWGIDDPPRLAFTNLVGCLPLGEDGNKVAEPPKESIEACAPRVVEFIRLAKPKLIVMVGDLATKWIPKILEKADGPVSRGSSKESTGTKRALLGGKATKAIGSNRHTSQANLISIKRISIIHPAALLRMDVSRKGLEIERCIVTLQDAFEDLTDD